jgi:hypothetical protein
MIHKTLHRKPKIEQHERNMKPRVNSGAFLLNNPLLIEFHLKQQYLCTMVTHLIVALQVNRYGVSVSQMTTEMFPKKCLNIPKAAIRGRKSKKGRQYNDQATKGQREKKSLRRIPKW